MAGFNRCRQGESDFKKARALKLRAEDPNLTADAIAERLNVSRHTMRSWLEGAGTERTEDARGLGQRMAAKARTRAEYDAALDIAGGAIGAGTGRISREQLDSLAAFAAGELDDGLGSVTARPRNMALARLCPESL